MIWGLVILNQMKQDTNLFEDYGAAQAGISGQSA